MEEQLLHHPSLLILLMYRTQMPVANMFLRIPPPPPLVHPSLTILHRCMHSSNRSSLLIFISPCQIVQRIMHHRTLHTLHIHTRYHHHPVDLPPTSHPPCPHSPPQCLSPLRHLFF